jgi:hypothetical protein
MKLVNTIQLTYVLFLLIQLLTNQIHAEEEVHDLKYELLVHNRRMKVCDNIIVNDIPGGKDAVIEAGKYYISIYLSMYLSIYVCIYVSIYYYDFIILLHQYISTLYILQRHFQFLYLGRKYLESIHNQTITPLDPFGGAWKWELFRYLSIYLSI